MEDVSAHNSETPLCIANSFRRTLTCVYFRYHLSDLVHGDLSPYNILVHNSQLVVIDVGQAVVTEHPRARFFLERDCAEVTRFFKRASKAGKCQGIPILTPAQVCWVGWLVVIDIRDVDLHGPALLWPYVLTAHVCS